MFDTGRDVKKSQRPTTTALSNRGFKEQVMAVHGIIQSHLQDLVSNPDQSTLVRNASRSYKRDKDPKVLLSTDDVEPETCPFWALKGDLPHLVRLNLNSLSDLW